MQPKQGLLQAENSCISDEQLNQIIRRNESIEDYYHIEREVFARGKFACVRRVKHRQNGRQYAAKIMKRRRLRHGDVTDEILHEIRVLLSVADSERIVRLYEVYETRLDFTLVLELAEGGELQKVLDDEESIQEKQCRRLIRQIIEGVQYLHQKRIAHLDIKPQNILLTDALPDGHVKLCDFGISRMIEDHCEVREIMGTVDYMPPEILQYEPISLASDMWSLGIVTYVLLSGHSPFGGDDKQQTYSNITSSDLEFPDKLFGHISDDAKNFIRKLLNRDPKKRLNCEECLKHPWLSSVDNNNMVDETLSIDNLKHITNDLNNQTSDLDDDDEEDDDEKHSDNDDENMIVVAKSCPTSESKSSSMTLSSICSLDDQLDPQQQRQNDDLYKDSLLPSSNCDSGLGENICDTMLMTTTAVNNDKMDSCQNLKQQITIELSTTNSGQHSNDNNNDDDNKENQKPEQPKQNLSIPMIMTNTKYNHKRLSSDIFPDRKSIIAIVSNSLQTTSKKSTSESSMSSSSLSSSSTKTTISGDRPSRTLLVNVHNQMMMMTTDKQQNNSNSIINDHSPPSTPSKKFYLSIDDYDNINNDNVDQWKRSPYSNIRSLSMERLNTTPSLHDDNDDINHISTIPLATIETHSITTASTMDSLFAKKINDNNNDNPSLFQHHHQTAMMTKTTIIHHQTTTSPMMKNIDQ
uniref:Death-associated protein kinase related-like n=1 Tax=Dermatophagoides pteronyssinus TaxID=6956 RepID=A0A6P6Y2K9_DERPT|nr:death-associated protein kinase related-like [Dermatophagoides pteronyssinus]